MEPQIIFYDAKHDTYEDAEGQMITNMEVFLETCRKLRIKVELRLMEQD